MGKWNVVRLRLDVRSGSFFICTLNVRSQSPVKRSEVIVILNRLFERGPLHGYNKQVWSDIPTTHPNFKDVLEATATHEGELRNSIEYFVRLK